MFIIILREIIIAVAKNKEKGSSMLEYIPLLPIICLITFALLWRFQFTKKFLFPIYFSILFLFCGVWLTIGPFIQINGKPPLVPLFGEAWYWYLFNGILGLFCFYIAIGHIRIAINNYKQIYKGNSEIPTPATPKNSPTTNPDNK